MAGIIENMQRAFQMMREELAGSLVYGLLVVLTSFLGVITYPILTSWFYRNIGLAEKSNWKYPVIILLIVGVLAFVIMLLGVGITSFTARNPFAMLTSMSLVLLLIGIVQLVFLYTIFGNLVGKIEGFVIDIKKSLLLFVNILIASIIVGVLYILVAFISLAVPILGLLLMAVVGIFSVPYISILAGIVAKEL